MVPALTNPPTVTGWPSPAFAAGSGVCIGFPPDIVGSIYDGHPFLVSVIGQITTGASITALPKLYQVPATIVAAGTQTTVANDNAILVGAATTVATATVDFQLQVQLLWSNATKKLTGFVTSYYINGVGIATGTPSGTANQLQPTTAVSSVAVGDLNFAISFTFGTANASNSFTIKEFVIDRA